MPKKSLVRMALATALLAITIGAALGAESGTIHLHSAGSLRAALTDIAAAYSSTYHIAIEPVYGASGILNQQPDGELVEVVEQHEYDDAAIDTIARA